jgi:hypothetical protein
MRAYLFVHFKEKKTPEGEQVYFALSTDGFHWEEVNGGEPVLWSTQGDRGVRDFTITRTKEGGFYILATDLSLSLGFDGKYQGSWANISRNGSKCLVLWESEDLVHWSGQRMIELGDENFGCLWAPDIFYDEEYDDYVIHWSSAHCSNDFGNKGIYYTRTKDFLHFTKPKLLYQKEDSGVIDSCIREYNRKFYRFLKSEDHPLGVIFEKGDTLTGPYTRSIAFDEEMSKLQFPGAYEAPTLFQLDDGRWCLMIDFFGCGKEEQGYVPYICDNLETGEFVRADEAFHFPYGFKHGTVLPIMMEEYERIKEYNFKEVSSD